MAKVTRRNFVRSLYVARAREEKKNEHGLDIERKEVVNSLHCQASATVWVPQTKEQLENNYESLFIVIFQLFFLAVLFLRGPVAHRGLRFTDG